jgi:hypothetical protein
MAGLSFLGKKWFRLIFAGCLIAATAWGVYERNWLMAEYAARRLTTATEADRQRWIDSLAGRPVEAERALMPYLHSTDSDACASCGVGLAELVRRWGPTAEATREVARRLTAEFDALPSLGKQQALLIAAAALTPLNEERPAAELAICFCRLLDSGVSRQSDELRPAVLLLAIRLTHQLRPANSDVLKTCRTLVNAGLGDKRPNCRSNAVRLAATPGVDLLARIPPLLFGAAPDRSPEVRRTALVLIAQHEELASIEELLPLLHDNSFEIRVLCEKTLRSRGLTTRLIELARLMSDSQPAVRAQVPSKVLEFPDLDTQVWLSRLSRDPSPAVRAAVVRTVGEMEDFRLRERLHEMAANDPSPTVRELADYYLAHPKRR